MNKPANIKPTMLVIMDGWGWREETTGNATKLAETPNLDRYAQQYPTTIITASGEAVGLPRGQMGNSEVGHLNLGAGRIVYQELTRINMALEDQSFFQNQAFLTLLEQLQANGGTIHLWGLVSDGGVHSQMEHLVGLLQLAAEKGLSKVCVHAFLDGRDTPPTSGVEHIARLQQYIQDSGSAASIATLIGRYYAMDRDKRWERVQQAYDALVKGLGYQAAPGIDPVSALQQAYERGETDEFVKPIILPGAGDAASCRVKNGDGIIFFNFRADRARELTRAFTEKGFAEFAVSDRPQLAGFVTMTLYDKTFELPVAFPPHHLEHILGQEVSAAGLKQLRIAETEKYAHVTYFFNGGEEKAFPGEDRVLVPSPREVATYDQKPQMSALEVADQLLQHIAQDRYALIIVNFANGDMVGHTGILPAAIQACHTVDTCVGRIVEAWRAKGYAALITADHGNAETMIDEHGGPHTAHTTVPVPFYLIDDTRRNLTLRQGILADVAPTILHLMGLAIPAEMSGEVLYV